MITHYIDRGDALAALCARLRDSPWLALDTEFLREKTYFARLCLIQIATEHEIAVVDPVALEDLSPLLAVLYEPALLKVLHAARQDLEIFLRLGGRVPAPVFDTQIAASLAGFGDQAGYATLVEGLAGVKLPKLHTRSDWCARPLDPEQIRYAEDDVRHLGTVYEKLRARLAAQGRSEWVQADFAELEDPASYAGPGLEAWRALRGAQRLDGPARFAAERLHAWREEVARESDRPRRWILSDDALIDMARIRPDSRNALLRIRGIEEGFVRRHGQALQALLDEARKAPESAWPAPEREDARLTPAEEARVDAVMAILRTCAARHEVSPGMLAGRRTLERAVRGERDMALFHGWRAEIAGSEIRRWLDGASGIVCAEAGVDIRGL